MHNKTRTKTTSAGKTPVTDQRRQATQPGYDGSFMGMKPMGTVVQDGDSSTSMSGVGPSTFEGFNALWEQNTSAGPSTAMQSGLPVNGQFPGQGTGFQGFDSDDER